MGEIGNIVDNSITIQKLSTEPVKTLNNYINYHFNNDMNYSEIINAFDELNNLLYKANYVVDLYTINDLLNSNIILKHYLNVVFNQNKKVIINAEADLVFNNPLLVSMIDVYCTINSITINDDDTFDISKSQDSMKQYLYEIRKYPVLEQEEVLELFKRIKTDEKARRILIECNLKLVVSIARKFIGCGQDLQDIIQDGTIGLTSAIDKYDPSKGAKFSTYATIWIKNAIYNGLNQKSRLITIPYRISRKVKDIQRVSQLLEEKLLREPTDEEIAKELKIRPNTVTNLKNIGSPIVSLDKTLEDGEDTIMHFLKSDALTPEEEYMSHEAERDVDCLLRTSNLSDCEQEIIVHHFGINNNQVLSFRALGKKYNHSPEGIRFIEKKALKKMRYSDYGRSLEEFMHPKESEYIKPKQIERPVVSKDKLVSFNLMKVRKRLFNKDEVTTEEYLDLLRSLDREVLLRNIYKLSDEDKKTISLFLSPVQRNATTAAFVMTNNKAFEEATLKLMELYINDCIANSKIHIKTRK